MLESKYVIVQHNGMAQGKNNWYAKQGRIQSKLEGGAVGGGGAEKFEKLVTRIRCIQQFLRSSLG